MFDIESETPEKDFDHFCGVLEAIEENSPDARIFLLIHKMDLVAEEDREAILEDRKRLIEESCLSCGVENFSCFGTSIWDVSCCGVFNARRLDKACSRVTWISLCVPSGDTVQGMVRDCN